MNMTLSGEPAKGPESRPGTAIALGSITAETALAIRSGNQDYMVSARDIVQWVAPTAPVGEAKKFLVICKTVGLNPLVGEIDLLLFKDKWQAVIRKNGMLKAARRDPGYDGHESGISIQAYHFEPKTKKNVKAGPIIDVPGTVLPDGHLVVGGWCRMYRKGISRPVYKRVSFTEYGKSVPGPWQQIPCTMIEKVAIAHAGRECIDMLAGVYDESELERNPERNPEPARVATATVVAPQMMPAVAPKAIETPKAIVENFEVQESPRSTKDQVYEILDLLDKLKASPENRAAIMKRRGVAHFLELDQYAAQDLIHSLGELVSQQEFDPLGDNKPESATEPVPAPESATAPEVIDAEVIEAETEPAPATN